jgi:hypothetical protein
MEEYVSIHKIVSLIKQYQPSQVGIGLNSFGFGNIVEFGNTNNTGMTPTYPFVFVTPQNISYEENIVTYNMSLIFADRINDDLSNEVDVISDMDIQARRFMSFIKRGMNQTPDLYEKMDIVLPTNAVPFQERFNDFVGGVALDCNFVVFTDINACDYYEPEPSPTPSNTASVTPTPTITPTNTTTPTTTPTNTPTPTRVFYYYNILPCLGGVGTNNKIRSNDPLTIGSSVSLSPFDPTCYEVVSVSDSSGFWVSNFNTFPNCAVCNP